MVRMLFALHWRDLLLLQGDPFSFALARLLSGFRGLSPRLGGLVRGIPPEKVSCFRVNLEIKTVRDILHVAVVARGMEILHVLSGG